MIACVYIKIFIYMQIIVYYAYGIYQNSWRRFCRTSRSSGSPVYGQGTRRSQYVSSQVPAEMIQAIQSSWRNNGIIGGMLKPLREPASNPPAGGARQRRDESGPCCFGVAKAPFVSLGGWKAPWRPWPAGPCVSFGGWKTAQTAIVFL